MTAPRPDTLEREKDKLFVTDAELIRRLGAPERMARQALATLDADPKYGFPPKQIAGRRYWPAVSDWLLTNDLHSPRRKSDELGEKVPAIGCVYFLASPTHVKIGFSARLKNRAKAIRDYHYEKLELLTTIGNVTRADEANLHRRFKAHRVPGKREWFVRCPEIEDFIKNHQLVHWRERPVP